jgi:hypothetical protein
MREDYGISFAIPLASFVERGLFILKGGDKNVYEPGMVSRKSRRREQIAYVRRYGKGSAGEKYFCGVSI